MDVVLHVGGDLLQEDPFGNIATSRTALGVVHVRNPARDARLLRGKSGCGKTFIFVHELEEKW
jgi:hypothetical protein